MTGLTCDVCGGKLLVDAGGKTATCQYCGTQHSMERMREKIQEIKGSVSIVGDVNVSGIAGTDTLLERANEFFEARDYQRASEYFNRVLDLDPQNSAAREGLTKTQAAIERNRIDVGQIYKGKVAHIAPFGAYVELQPGKEGFVHISQLGMFHRERVEDEVLVGDPILVLVTDIDAQGRINLSQKAALAKFAEEGRPTNDAAYPIYSRLD